MRADHTFMLVNSLPDFLQPLAFLVRPFPREAVAAAVARREESTPHLLHAIEWADQHSDEANDARPPYMLHLFAMFLLAQFRETRAYPLIARLARNPELETLTGDVVTENLGSILASVSGGDTSLIEELIEDPQIEQFVRAAAITALGVLLDGGLKTRAQISSYLGELFAHRLDREPSYVWDSAIALCADFQFVEHLEAIRESYRAELVDPFCDSLEDVERELLLPPGTSTRVRSDRYEFIDDTTAEMASWWCFDPDSAAEDELDDLDLPADEWLAGELDDDDGAAPVVRVAPKVGRNDQCPCGSGKKYKKCCGQPGAA